MTEFIFNDQLNNVTRSVFFSHEALVNTYPNTDLTKEETKFDATNISLEMKDLLVYQIIRDNNGILRIGESAFNPETNLQNISVVYNKEYHFHFHPGDILHIVLQYNPPIVDQAGFQGLFGGQQMNSRKYEIIIHLT